MRKRFSAWILLGLLAAGLASGATRLPPQRIAVVDVGALQERSSIAREIERRAAALERELSTRLGAERARADAALARDLAFSALLETLPEAIAEVATEHDTDLVLDLSQAEELALGGLPDLTAAVEAELGRRLAGLEVRVP